MNIERHRIQAERKKLRKRYGALFDDVVKILFEADSMLISFDYNNDEYETEASTIVPRLKHAMSEQDVAIIIHEEFCKWFSRDAGSVSDYSPIAVKVWQAWREFSDRRIPDIDRIYPI